MRRCCYGAASRSAPNASRADLVNLMTMLRYTYVDTPIGSILIAGDGKAIIETYFVGAKPKPDWIRDDDGLRDAANQLRAYFAGEVGAQLIGGIAQAIVIADPIRFRFRADEVRFDDGLAIAGDEDRTDGRVNVGVSEHGH